MAVNILNLTEKSADEFIGLDQQDIKADYSTYKQMYNGDHWRSGTGWVGPKPEGTDQTEIITRIKRQFVSRNAVREVIKRHTNSVFGNFPTIEILPAVEEEEGGAEMDETQMQEIALLKKHINDWIRERKVIDKLKKSLSMVLYGEVSILRFYIPRGFLDEEGRMTDVESLEDALNLIWFDVADIESATVYTDQEVKRELGIFKYTNDDDDEFVEFTFKLVETDFLPESDDIPTFDFPFFASGNVEKTFIINMSGTDIDSTEPMQLHGNLTMHKVRRESLITEQIRQNQDMLNKSLTMWSANMDWSAFVERIVLNGMPPGQWSQDNDGNWEFEKTGELSTGPSTTSFITGTPRYNDAGEITGAENPSVVFRDPIDPETFDKTSETFYQNILDECHQSHIMLQSESQPSGRSRREAKEDFKNDIMDSVSRYNQAGKWLIETLIYLATWIAGSDKEEPEYIAQFECNPNLGAISKEDIEIVTLLKEKNLMSDETAMARVGIDDVTGEKAKIDTTYATVVKFLQVMNEGQFISPTLVRELYRRMIADIDILSDLEDGEVNTILSEIESSASSAIQENDFLGQISGRQPEPPTQPTE